ncbi:MAG TPA: hypothetical protein VFA04_11595 [Bryobacteraceae bacterium]|nr:hypothetical protein [Bryobacteraceae bacterium]
MRNSAFACLICASSLAMINGQTKGDFSTPPGAPAYLPAAPVDLTHSAPQTLNNSLSGLVLKMPPGGAPSSAIFMNPNAGRQSAADTPNQNSVRRPGNVQPGGNIPGLDTVPTFNGVFSAQGGPSSMATPLFPYTIVGNNPAQGGTTTLPARITEVSLVLLNADGSVFTTIPFSAFEQPMVNSPQFQPSVYSSSPGQTQFADAVQRAEFFQTMRQDWHTLLESQVVDRVTITVPRFVNVQLNDGSVIQARSYYTGPTGDKNTFVIMLDLLFHYFYTNIVINEINAGNFQPDGVNIAAFPNTFLASLNLDRPTTPGQCCVLGFHNFFYDPTAQPQPRWLTEYASWISPGVFTNGFADITALSHETSEMFNDPFVDNVTPAWQFPGEPSACQGNLEVGDPLEVISNPTYPVTSSRRDAFIYHPQNVALLQWFEMGATSNAIGGAFSYPNTSILTHSATPCTP